MERNIDVGQVSVQDISPWGKARVVHYMREALRRFDEGLEAMGIALDYLEDEGHALVGPVEEALAGRLSFSELTFEQRAFLDKIVDRSIDEPPPAGND